MNATESGLTGVIGGDISKAGLENNVCVKKNALFRIRTAIGHLSGIEKMIESDAYCIDILKQITAVQSSISKIGEAISENHMSHCILSTIQEGQGEEKIQELMETVKFLKCF